MTSLGQQAESRSDVSLSRMERFVVATRPSEQSILPTL